MLRPSCHIFCTGVRDQVAKSDATLLSLTSVVADFVIFLPDGVRCSPLSFCA